MPTFIASSKIQDRSIKVHKHLFSDLKRHLALPPAQSTSRRLVDKAGVAACCPKRPLGSSLAHQWNLQPLGPSEEARFVRKSRLVVQSTRGRSPLAQTHPHAQMKAFWKGCRGASNHSRSRSKVRNITVSLVTS